jgi:predicted nucleic acid-binding protein
VRALLDVNVLIALLDGAHVGHDKATNWLGQEIAQGWASCPLTQNGCIRIMSQPAYPGAVAAAEVAMCLACVWPKRHVAQPTPSGPMT